MAEADGLILQVLPVADSDAEELADLAAELNAELLSLDGTSVAPLFAQAAPEGAKGLGDVAGWLVAQFGTLDGLRALVADIEAGCCGVGRVAFSRRSTTCGTLAIALWESASASTIARAETA